jgi:hypothetical protein
LDTRTMPALDPVSAVRDESNLLPPTLNTGNALKPPRSPEVRPADAAMQAEDMALPATTRVLLITICSISIHQTEQYDAQRCTRTNCFSNLSPSQCNL